MLDWLNSGEGRRAAEHPVSVQLRRQLIEEPIPTEPIWIGGFSNLYTFRICPFVARMPLLSPGIPLTQETL